MPDPAPSQLPALYARWQERLAQEFFTGRRGQPVVMFVDREELDGLTSSENGSTELALAVRSMVDVTQGTSMFDRVNAAQRAWQHGTRSEPPPTLPMLALSVLAASEMRNDSVGTATSYYIRLAEVFLPGQNGAELEDLRYDLRERGAFVHVVAMWVTLGTWLDEHHGDHGISTIPNTPVPLTRIGYPLSQTLIRRSDRESLTKFFDRMQLTRDGVPGPEALLQFVKLWTGRRPQGFSDGFLDGLDEPDLRALLKPLIHKLATNWDGRVVTAEGLRRLDIRLAIDVDRAESWWVIPLVPEPPTDILSGTSSGRSFRATITPDPHTSMYQAHGLPPVSTQALCDGLLGIGTLCVASFRPSDFITFIDSADAGGWISVDAIRAFEDHVLAIRPQFADDLEVVLSLAADPGWHRLRDDFADRVLNGYVIYYAVTFSDRDHLADAIELLPGRVAVDIELGTTLRPRLVNGLPLYTNLGRGTYLAGGAPDLELPVGARSRTVDVSLNGSPPDSFTATIFPIPLSIILQSETGTQTIEADGETLVFDVLNGVGPDWIPSGVGTIGWKDGELGSRTDGAICGALTPIDFTPAIILVRRGASATWILDHMGHWKPLPEPPKPGFLPGATFAYFEVSRDQGCWVVQRFTSGWSVTPLLTREPTFQALTTADQRLWRLAADHIRTSNLVWAQYLTAWDHYRGH